MPARSSNAAWRLSLRRLAPIAAAAILWAASLPASAAAPCNDYDFQFEAVPSFLGRSSVEVHARHERSTVTIAIAHHVETWSLDDGAAEAFCSRMRQVMAIEQSSDKRMGFDGTRVSGELSAGSSPPYKFDFWSPDKEKQPRDFAVVDAVFTLFESTTPSCELNEYLEWLATFFPFGLPARTIPGSPLIVRFYGNLWSRDEDALEPLLMSLPTDTDVEIDMTNFNGMGPELSSAFRDLASRNAQVKWLASPQLAAQLSKLGIKPQTIHQYKNPRCLAPGTHFSRR